MNVTSSLARGLGLAVLTAAVLAPAAQADVSRIREKALELEQKLNRSAYETSVKGERPSRARVYKDFDFILKESKVEDAAAETGDPHAPRLRLYLIESIVESEIASYADALTDFLRTSTVDLDGQAIRFEEGLDMLAGTKEDRDRRKIYSVLSSMIETATVFRTDILDRRTKAYQNWGYDHYAAFYAEREGVDLDALAASANHFLTETQPLYDSLFEEMAQAHLGVEGRKVRFYDLPFLVQGGGVTYPSAERAKRVKSVFRGLGVEVNAQVDEERRPGKTFRARVYPVIVPTEVLVGLSPNGNPADAASHAYALGEAAMFTENTATAFEPAYLPNRPAQAALAWLPRMVLDEPAWLASAGGDDAAALTRYRAFASLYEARWLAALTLTEISAYSGNSLELDKEFRDLARTATGARLSGSDAKRVLEFVTPLESASRFQGLIAAAELRESLRATAGADWYTDGKAAAMLKPMWAAGGATSLADIRTACGDHAGSGASAFLTHIQAMLDAGNGAE